jgi:hypothetical protein
MSLHEKEAFGCFGSRGVLHCVAWRDGQRKLIKGMQRLRSSSCIPMVRIFT